MYQNRWKKYLEKEEVFFSVWKQQCKKDTERPLLKKSLKLCSIAIKNRLAKSTSVCAVNYFLKPPLWMHFWTDASFEAQIYFFKVREKTRGNIKWGCFNNFQFNFSRWKEGKKESLPTYLSWRVKRKPIQKWVFSQTCKETFLNK